MNPVVLRGLTWDHPRGLDSLRAVAEQWRASWPDVTVHWSARSLKDFGDLALEAMVDHYDLLVIDHPHVPHGADTELLLPLDGAGHDGELARLAAQSVGLSHASYRHADRQWGLAIDAAAQVSVRRPDLLATAPRDWDEVFRLADAGHVLWPGKPTDAIASFLTLAANLGSPVGQRADGFVDRATGRTVLDQLHRLADAVPAACLSQNPIDVAESLATGDQWWYAPLAFGYTNYGRAGFRRHRLAYGDIPAGPGGVAGSCLGGAGIAVSARTSHPAEAVAYAVWVAGADIQRGSYYRGGGQPGNAVAWDDDAVNAHCLDFFRATRRTLDAAVVRPRDAAWGGIQETAGVLVNRALRREIDDLACLDALDDAYRRQPGGEQA